MPNTYPAFSAADALPLRAYCGHEIDIKTEKLSFWQSCRYLRLRAACDACHQTCLGKRKTHRDGSWATRKELHSCIAWKREKREKREKRDTGWRNAVYWVYWVYWGTRRYAVTHVRLLRRAFAGKIIHCERPSTLINAILSFLLRKPSRMLSRMKRKQCLAGSEDKLKVLPAQQNSHTNVSKCGKILMFAALCMVPGPQPWDMPQWLSWQIGIEVGSRKSLGTRGRCPMVSWVPWWPHHLGREAPSQRCAKNAEGQRSEEKGYYIIYIYISSIYIYRHV